MPKKLPDSERFPDPVGDRLEFLAGEVATPNAPAVVDRQSLPKTQERVGEEPVAPSPPRRRSKTATPKPRPRGKERQADTNEYLQQHKARFTQSEAAANDEIMGELAKALGAKPSQASLTRALWSLLRDSQQAILKSRRRQVAPMLRRPPNGFGIETVEYERRLAEYLSLLLKQGGE